MKKLVLLAGLLAAAAPAYANEVRIPMVSTVVLKCPTEPISVRTSHPKLVVLLSMWATGAITSEQFIEAHPEKARRQARQIVNTCLGESA